MDHGLRDQAFHGKFRINNRLQIEETNDDISWLHFKSLPLNLFKPINRTSAHFCNLVYRAYQHTNHYFQPHVSAVIGYHGLTNIKMIDQRVKC